MKRTFAAITLLWLSLSHISCNQNCACSDKSESQQAQIDSLKVRIEQLETSVKPRLSVLMNRLQGHHGRMWQPGITNDWKLAGYELAKVKETLSDLVASFGTNKYAESSIGLEINKLQATMTQLEQAVTSKNKDVFVEQYSALTTQCNTCHKATGLDFYKVIQPSTPAYSGEIE
jgi:hypothetical protein